MRKAQIHFTKKIKLLAIVLISIFSVGVFYQSVEAATGINPQINFQGKVVNKTAGTNVANGDYDFTFRLYDDPAAGSLLWTENHTAANDVTVTDGIFRVALGSITSLSSVDFNSDSIYLEIEFEGETMGTRIRFASVPYAFNAQKVNGLTVTNNGGNTLNIAASKTFTVSNSLTLTGTDSTSFAFPSTGGGTVIVSNISGQNIAGALNLTGASGNLSLAGTTGLTFSGTGGDITFTNGEKIDNDVNGVIAVTGDLDVSGALSAGTGNAFAVNSSGAITASAGLVLTSGAITLGGSTGAGQCITGGASASWGSCGTGGGGSSNWVLNAGQGTLNPINNTVDLLIGGTATTSAKFAVLNVNGTGPATASVAGSFIIQPQNGAGGSLGIGTNTPGSIIDAVRNQNSFTSIQVTNANSGTNASADLLANNDLGAYVNVGIGSSGYTLVPMLQNRAYLYTGSASNGIVLYTSGSDDPILFATDDTERMRLTQIGLLGIGTDTPISELHVTRALSQGATGKALAIFDQIENQDLITASKSGTTYFTVNDVGRINQRGSGDSFSAIRYSNDTTGNSLYLAKSRSGTVGTNTIVSSGDSLGLVNFLGSDGTSNYITAASVFAQVDGTPGANDMPGRLIFSTTLDGASSPTERMRINNAGNVNIGGDSTPDAMFTVGSTSQFQVNSSGAIAATTGITMGGETVTDFSGNGISVTGNALTVNLTTSGTTGSTSSNSGLEVSSSGVALLKGCTDNQLLKWTDAGGWACADDSGGGSSTTVVKTSNETVTNSTTLQNDDELFFSVSASTGYSVELVLNQSSTNTTHDFKFDWSYPTGAAGSLLANSATNGTTGRANCNMIITGTNSNDCAVNNAASATRLPTTINGILVINGTSGTMQFRWAGNAASASNSTTVYANSYITYATLTGADLAEIYYTYDHSIKPGDVVAIDPGGGGIPLVKKSENRYDKNAIGIVSTNPGLVMGDASSPPDGAVAVVVALAGRVPVEVSNENGPIRAGDYLTPSSIPGVAMKADKSGIVIGQALTGFQPLEEDSRGQIGAFIKTSFFLGDTSSIAGLINDDGNMSRNKRAIAVLGTFLKQVESPPSSEIYTDRLLAGTEIIAPNITADTITARKIRADQIEGLEIIAGKYVLGDMTQLKADLADLIGFKEKIENEKTESASNSAKSSQDLLLENINQKLNEASESSQMAPSSTNSAGLGSDGLSIIENSLRVKGNGLFESFLTVIESLTTNDFIANGLSTFFGKAVFKDEVDFQKPVSFNKDTGGEVTISKGQKKVEVKFTDEFEKTPVVNVSVAFEEQKDSDGKIKSSEELESKFFDQNYSFIIVNKSETGFTVVLNKKAEDDIYFTWTALQVKDEISLQDIGPN